MTLDANGRSLLPIWSKQSCLYRHLSPYWANPNMKIDDDMGNGPLLSVHSKGNRVATLGITGFGFEFRRSDLYIAAQLKREVAEEEYLVKVNLFGSYPIVNFNTHVKNIEQNNKHDSSHLMANSTVRYATFLYVFKPRGQLEKEEIIPHRKQKDSEGGNSKKNSCRREDGCNQREGLVVSFV
ncbi:hypothetical protein CEXT_477101 [Caerostris extrusa]|uniref:DUF4283 domain-containing protein n=1 Tax=Caerostris extrusa TaxID=172846 RepID=A0AAV4VQR8_CAEEX|nr:hypothetical protein CEXT_477101 [Caerostris extrusa]